MNKGLQSDFLNDCFVTVGLVWGIVCRCRSSFSETITFLRFGWISNQWSEGCLYRIIFKTQHKSRRKGLSSNGMFVTMGSSLSSKSVSFGKTNVCENVSVFFDCFLYWVRNDFTASNGNDFSGLNVFFSYILDTNEKRLFGKSAKNGLQSPFCERSTLSCWNN